MRRVVSRGNQPSNQSPTSASPTSQHSQHRSMSQSSLSSLNSDEETWEYGSKVGERERDSNDSTKCGAEGRTSLYRRLLRGSRGIHATGEILFNGHKFTNIQFRQLTSYVKQTDTLHPVDTVREALDFSGYM